MKRVQILLDDGTTVTHRQLASMTFSIDHYMFTSFLNDAGEETTIAKEAGRRIFIDHYIFISCNCFRKGGSRDYDKNIQK